MTTLNWDDPDHMRWQAPVAAIGGLLLFIIGLIALLFVTAR
jgi:hypothetical protein